MTRHAASAAHEHGRHFVYIVAIIAAISGLLFGYDTGVISGAILFIRSAFDLTTVTTEVTTSTVLAGAIVGAAFGGVMANRFGRRKTIIVAAVDFILGALVAAVAPVLGWLLLGRFLVGLAIGVASFVAPMYISEVAPANARGAMVSYNQLAVTIGIVLAYLIDYAFAGIQGWRWMLGLAAVPALVLALGMWKMPSSPRWLMMIGKPKAAERDLENIRSTADVSKEMGDIDHSLRTEKGAGLRDLETRRVRPALIVGVGLALLQQFTGINTVIYYAPMIFNMAGFSSSAVAILATAGVGLVNVIFTFIAILLVDRVGRRPLLLIGIAGMVLGLAVLGFNFLSPGTSAARGWIAIGSLMLYVAAFAIGLGPIFWLIISEIYPIRVRGLAMSLATVVNWSANFLVALTFLSLINGLGQSGTFWLFAAIGIGAWFFSYFLVPETKGRTLEQIQEEWQGGVVHELKRAA